VPAQHEGSKGSGVKIGILQTGRAPTDLQATHGDYDDMFKRLLAGRGFEFRTYPVLDGIFPESVRDAAGWLVTGSRFGVYEPHAWIAPLEDFLRGAYAAGVPIVGICFGHQILAQALGGKVEKFSGGWSVGLERYTLKGRPGETRVVAWHQDQVVEKPADAEVIGSSPFCRYAALAYGDKALSFQPHPEFTTAFGTDLLTARGAVLPEGIAAQAATGLGGETDSAEIADTIADFFLSSRQAQPR